MGNMHEHQDGTLKLRRAMVDRLELLNMLHLPAVAEAFRAVPRHLFVPGVELATAYSDIPIVTRWQGGQAISSSSAPSVMAIMLEMLDLRPGQRVLEIGAGTGYNAALMARIVGEAGQVVTVDLDEDIVLDARAHLQAVESKNVQVICGDGGLGYAANAPYDHIIFTVCTADIPSALRAQLRPGGRLVMPFQALSFQSKLAEPPLLPDQFLLAFTWTGTHFEALDMCPCGFMVLRGDFAQQMQQVSNAGSENSLSALLPSGIDVPGFFQLLETSASLEVTTTHLAFPEIYGLRLWLALREPQFCEVYVPEASASDAIPAQLRRGKNLAAAIGLCAEQTVCLLSVEEEEHGQPVDRQRPFRLTIRRFGPDQSLSERLREAVTTWSQAGHPFVWGLDARMKDLALCAYPPEISYPVQPYDTVIARRDTCFVFTPRATSDPGTDTTALP